MKRSRATRGGDLTSELKEIVDTCIEQSSEIFDPMVERAHKAEKVVHSFSCCFTCVILIIVESQHAQNPQKLQVFI
jgi:hypothetical protein